MKLLVGIIWGAFTTACWFLSFMVTNLFLLPAIISSIFIVIYMINVADHYWSFDG